MSRPEWKDISSYSQTDKERVPHSFELKVGTLRLIVTRWIHGDPNKWYASLFHGGFDRREMKSPELEAAKKEAVSLTRQTLQRAIEGLP